MGKGPLRWFCSLSLSPSLCLSFCLWCTENIFILSPSVEGMKLTPKQGPHGASASLQCLQISHLASKHRELLPKGLP